MRRLCHIQITSICKDIHSNLIIKYKSKGSEFDSWLQNLATDDRTQNQKVTSEPYLYRSFLPLYPENKYLIVKEPLEPKIKIILSILLNNILQVAIKQIQCLIKIGDQIVRSMESQTEAIQCHLNSLLLVLFLSLRYSTENDVSSIF